MSILAQRPELQATALSTFSQNRSSALEWIPALGNFKEKPSPVWQQGTPPPRLLTVHWGWALRLQQDFHHESL
ncbi:hypothetical protein Y1Q_0015523 [Alligator mississippiensis]|uniref:Uncharacterized protein n=1 Tax=Alligator mississippiensis TaxID=8496 RepID=A0A151NN43_ALLMI|nr:hypothetical protein Y1Q_0015523 [Alligator mississippiensis]